jgi:hypothetical protein
MMEMEPLTWTGDAFHKEPLWIAHHLSLDLVVFRQIVSESLFPPRLAKGKQYEGDSRRTAALLQPTDLNPC